MSRMSESKFDSNIRISKLRINLNKAIGESIGEITTAEIIQALTEESLFWTHTQVDHDLKEADEAATLEEESEKFKADIGPYVTKQPLVFPERRVHPGNIYP